MDKNSKKFPIIFTPRFLLRELLFDDFENIYNILSDRETIQFYDIEIPKKKTQVTRLVGRWMKLFYLRKGIRWGIEKKDGRDGLIGTCGFTRFNLHNKTGEIGYELNKDYWNQGIMSEIIPMILEYGFFIVGLNRIEAIVFKGNFFSAKLLLINGFKFEGLLRQRERWNGIWHDIEIYGLLKDDFNSRITRESNIYSNTSRKFLSPYRLFNTSKLQLPSEMLEYCNNAAEKIATDIDDFITDKSTVSIERTIARAMGIEGVNADGIPYPNIVVDYLQSKNLLADGVANWVINSVRITNKDPQVIAQMIDENIPFILDESAKADSHKQDLSLSLCKQNLEKISLKKIERYERLNKYDKALPPFLYIIIGTGDICIDKSHALVSAENGADIISIIRSTGQSLLEHVPAGLTHEGYGGTYSTQANFHYMRNALDEWAIKNGKYIRLSSYCSGLCMPEFAYMGAIEGLDNMVNDAFYGILYRNINTIRTFVDQKFSRKICSFADIIINTGEDNYYKTSDPITAASVVVCSQLINYYLAKLSGLTDSQIGIGNAYEIPPTIENGFLLELANAQLTREIFPHCPIKFMPPTRYINGDIFYTSAINTLYNLVSVGTKQNIHIVGMITEGTFTPLIQDRVIGLKSAKYVFENARRISDEIIFQNEGFIQNRSREIIQGSKEIFDSLLEKGIFTCLKEGLFGGIPRSKQDGVGLEGVFVKSQTYDNPILRIIDQEKR
ncbi:MAG: GNAT family N-acetyltransferase [Anaerolineaceae bacterium]